MESITDEHRREPLKVSTDGTAGPYIMVELDRLNELRRFLEDKKVRHWVDSHAIAFGGRPFIVTVNFGPNADGRKIQQILDSAYRDGFGP